MFIKLILWEVSLATIVAFIINQTALLPWFIGRFIDSGEFRIKFFFMFFLLLLEYIYWYSPSTCIPCLLKCFIITNATWFLMAFQICFVYHDTWIGRSNDRKTHASFKMIWETYRISDKSLPSSPLRDKFECGHTDFSCIQKFCRIFRTKSSLRVQLVGVLFSLVRFRNRLNNNHI